jgi:hypothetical protein
VVGVVIFEIRTLSAAFSREAKSAPDNPKIELLYEIPFHISY